MQASAADNGQCLVHDVNSFGGDGVVNGLISHVSSANVSLAESGEAVKAIAWHPSGILLLGTDAGEGRLGWAGLHTPGREHYCDQQCLWAGYLSVCLCPWACVDTMELARGWRSTQQVV